MKLRGLLFCIWSLSMADVYSQKMDGLDKSPMDMAYYPDNFAHDRKFAPNLIGDLPAMIRVTYSRPAKKGREVFGKLVPYDKVWRTGANEATEVKFYQDVTIQGKTVKAGTYSLFTIPKEKEWTIILNSDLDYWGAYSYDQAHDVLRITVPAKKSEAVIEDFSFKFRKENDKSAIMMLAWDATLIEVAIAF